MKSETKQKVLQRCGWLGVAAVVFYFAHVIVGNILYSGYDPVKQAISDLTAGGSPAELPARILSGFYGLFAIAFAVAFYLFFGKKLGCAFSIGAVLWIAMNAVSAIGYTLFPLSEGGKNSFQDVMHLLTTGLVVALSIASLILFAIGFLRTGKYKTLGYVTIGTLVLMASGSILSGAAPSIMGIGERICIYALQSFAIVLAIFMLKHTKAEPDSDKA